MSIAGIDVTLDYQDPNMGISIIVIESWTGGSARELSNHFELVGNHHFDLRKEIDLLGAALADFHQNR